MDGYKIRRWNQGDKLPQEGIFLIRHGPREGGSLPPRDAILTKEGKRKCLTFAHKWNGPYPDCIVSSPVPRCRETADLIQKAIAPKTPIFESQMLGDHGPFVINHNLLSETIINAKKSGTYSFLQRHVNGENIPGMLDRDIGCKRLISDLKHFHKEGNLTLAISHDSIIAALLAHGGCVPEPWPEPLNGAIINL